MLSCLRSTIPPHPFPRVSFSNSKFPGQDTQIRRPLGRREFSMRSGSPAAILLLCLFSAFGNLIYAQTGTTSLRGTVSDSKGAVLPGAAVTVTDKETGYSRNVKTDDHGEYQFLELPPSTYTVTVRGGGFAE